MSSVITVAFENWKAQEAATGKPVLLNEFVFANVPGLDPAKPIDRNEKLPPENQIVHRQAVNKAGLASENAVAYSVTLGAEVGNFDFNWIGLLNKESGTIAMITHAPTQKKLKTQDGQQGNVLTRSFLLEFQGAAKETQITTNAETWQIDFTARLSGIDEMQRLINVDNYGAAAFFNDGFEVTRSADQFTVKKGLGYVGGLRGQLAQNQILNNLRNTKIYADFSYQGNIVSQWNTVIKITSAATLSNYVDAAGFTHQVFAIASIDASGNVKDLRPKGALSSQSMSELEKRVNDGLNGKQDKGDYALRGESYTKTESNLKFQPTGNYQPAGNYAPAGDYATNTALNNGLNEKLDKTGGTTTGAISVKSSNEAISIQCKNEEIAFYSIKNSNGSRAAYFGYGSPASPDTLQIINSRSNTNVTIDGGRITINGKELMSIGAYGFGGRGVSLSTANDTELLSLLRNVDTPSQILSSREVASQYFPGNYSASFYARGNDSFTLFAASCFSDDVIVTAGNNAGTRLKVLKLLTSQNLAQELGSSSTVAISQKAVSESLFGRGKYIDVTSQRSSGVTYTNTTKTPRFISLILTENVMNPRIEVTVDNVVVMLSYNSSGTSRNGGVSMIPAGSTYSFTANARIQVLELN